MVSLIPAEGVAAPWSLPDSLRIVQKSPVDNVRTFSTITAAMNSITGASATNRFVVKVMPGTYQESFTLKPYVTLDGSGQDATIITTASTSTAGYTVSAGNESRIENLTVTYGGSASGVGGTNAVIILQQSAKVVIERIKVVMPGNTGLEAILVAQGGTLEMNNAHVLLTSGTAAAGDMAIDAFAGSVVKIRDSHFELEHRRTNVAVAVYATGITEITNTVFDLIASAGGAIEAVDGAYDASAKSTLQGCTVRIAVTDPTSGGFVGLSGRFEIFNTTVIGTGRVTYAAHLVAPSVIHNSTLVTAMGGLYLESAPPGSLYDIRNAVIGGPTIGIEKIDNQTSFRAANSQLIGGHNGNSGVDRVTNCVDGNLDPLPNL
jgi:hypothetical protein